MEAALRDRLVDFAARLGSPLTETAVEQISGYLDLLRIWNKTTRLTGPADDRTIVDRHVIDSLPVAPQVPRGGRLVDIGSGAGFPGLVVAIARPDITAILLEPRRRRASFLSEVVRTMKLAQVTVLCARAEEVRADPRMAAQCDAAVARAVRADDFLPLAEPFLCPGGLAIVMQTDVQARSTAPTNDFFEPAGHVDYNLPDATAHRLLLYRRVC